jgi:hypothetical protein
LLVDGSNTAFITDTHHLNFLEKSLNGSHRFTKLQEIIQTNPLGLKLGRDNYLYAPVNRVMTQLLESGISNWIVKNATTIKYQENVYEPVPLTLDYLWVWFSICGVGLMIALFVFFLEKEFEEKLPYMR